MAFPVVVATSSLAETGNTTSHAVPFPAPAGGILADDLLVCCVGIDGTNSTPFGFPAAWTSLVDTNSGGAVHAGVFFMRAAGGESGNFTVTSANEGGGWHVFCIRGAHLTVDPEIATTSSAGTANPNPPVLDPVAWDVDDTLWIAGAANDGNVAITAGPAGYSEFLNTRWANTSGAGVATAWQLDPAASDDPGTFTMASEQWVAWTVGVRPLPRAAVPAPTLTSQVGSA